MIKEACVETFEEAVLAEKNGADRVELCSDLANDGLTPSFDLMKKTVSELKIPVMVMIRPRAGDFVYSDVEITQMKAQIDMAKKAGASGVVFGLLTSDNKIDRKNTAVLCEYAHPLPVTFHKAIDIIEDPVEGVSILKKINGITRILTSGGKPTAREGAVTLIQMLKAGNDKITILVAGKVNDKNIEIIEERIGAKEYHGRKIVGELLHS
jgi:copper homeostasis protein